MAPRAASPSPSVRSRRPATPPVIVREATGADVDTIAAMRMALLHEESRSALFADPHPDAAARTLRITSAQLMDDDQVFLLAICGTEPVGTIRCAIASGTPVLRESMRGFLTAAYVAPRFRRQGVLRALVEAAAAWCASRDVHDLRLHCTRENDEGNAAWEALGFEVVEVVRRRHRKA